MSTRVAVAIGDQMFVEGGAEAFGAVQHVGEHDLTVDIENHGVASLPASAVRSVHDGKVVVDVSALPAPLQKAIRLAHRAEES